MANGYLPNQVSEKRFFKSSYLATPNEDFAATSFHLILGIIATAVLLISTIVKKNPQQFTSLSLLGAVILRFLLFCLLLKWQIWGNRLMLPIFILSTPAIGYFVIYYLSKSIRMTLLCLLATIALTYSLTSVYHPLIPLPKIWTNVNLSESILLAKRTNLYFRGNDKQLETYKNFVKQEIEVKNCRIIGLNIEKDDLEYPLWVIMAEESLNPFKIKHINVSNPSRHLPEEFSDSEICAVFTTK